jgi:hypothetical protein
MNLDKNPFFKSGNLPKEQITDVLFAFSHSKDRFGLRNVSAHEGQVLT